jgi:predicted nucleic acid-binding protein
MGLTFYLPARKEKIWSAGSTDFSARTVPIDLETAVLWGRLTARMQQNGTILPAIDGLLAATAIRHSMQLMTRNSRHFKETGVLLWDPWI